MIEVVQFHHEIRGGSSLPLLVGGSDGRKYVVKLRGSGDGVVANVIEWLAIKLGRLMHIPALEPVLLVLDASFSEQTEDPEIRELVEKSVGINFGTWFIDAKPIHNDERVQAIDSALKNDIFLYDLFLLNIDRNLRNPNIIFGRDGLWALDYSSSMTIRSAIDGRSYDKPVFLREVKRHPFYSHEIDGYDFIKRFKAIPDASICGIVDELPEEWLDHLRVGAAGGDKRDIIARRLIDEKNNASVLLKRLYLLKILKLESDEERSARADRNREAFEHKFGKM